MNAVALDVFPLNFAPNGWSVRSRQPHRHITLVYPLRHTQQPIHIPRALRPRPRHSSSITAYSQTVMNFLFDAELDQPRDMFGCEWPLKELQWTSTDRDVDVVSAESRTIDPRQLAIDGINEFGLLSVPGPSAGTSIYSELELHGCLGRNGTCSKLRSPPTKIVQSCDYDKPHGYRLQEGFQNPICAFSSTALEADSTFPTLDCGGWQQDQAGASHGLTPSATGPPVLDELFWLTCSVSDPTLPVPGYQARLPTLPGTPFKARNLKCQEENDALIELDTPFVVPATKPASLKYGDFKRSQSGFPTLPYPQHSALPPVITAFSNASSSTQAPNSDSSLRPVGKGPKTLKITARTRINSKEKYRCGICKQQGHNRRSCSSKMLYCSAKKSATLEKLVT